MTLIRPDNPSTTITLIEMSLVPNIISNVTSACVMQISQNTPDKFVARGVGTHIYAGLHSDKSLSHTQPLRNAQQVGQVYR